MFLVSQVLAEFAVSPPNLLKYVESGASTNDNGKAPQQSNVNVWLEILNNEVMVSI
jgi:hypothetical protein